MKMEDIARLAGVSKAAVSLAFSGKPGVAPETRERILQIAHENNYELKSRKHQGDTASRAITFLVFANSGLVVDSYYQQPFFRELIHYTEERCRMLGYSLMFSTISVDKLDEGAASLIDGGNSQGVILLGTNLGRAQISLLASKLTLPMVVIDNCYETLPIQFVEINNMMGAYDAASHLIEQGHRSIGYISSRDRIHNFEERRRGFAFAVQEHGAELHSDCIFEVEPTVLVAQESLKRKLSEYREEGKKLPSAFFCECDYMAISLIKTLAEMGVRVPEEVSVIGFDNISEARIVTPELTTVHVEKESMARLAVNALVQQIEGVEAIRSKISVDTQLVVRASTSAV
ncbi:LacI family DNA-binding transcriptional regulator [Paenibacillus sp. HB172176]|uniref:LacI family DNA-binding transcriptional regulator n=1 Tax=Paenibacillus sp. HB172176 TaxID=2493690 RepID=UPI00143919F0|nr:LacI family DNA-binding transcriptional regulator [Paenibacillus sp. HB172176]